MRSCSDLGPAQAASCHTRCCQPWQIYHHHSNACVYTKSKYLERYRSDDSISKRINICCFRGSPTTWPGTMSKDKFNKIKTFLQELSRQLAFLRGHFWSSLCLQSISPQPQSQPSTARGVHGDWSSLVWPPALWHLRPGRGGGRGGGREEGGDTQLLRQRPSPLVLQGGGEQVTSQPGSIWCNRLSLSSFNHRFFRPFIFYFQFSAHCYWRRGAGEC